MASQRGLIRPTRKLEAVSRALSQISAIPAPPMGAPSDAGNRPIAYRLKDYNGGKYPLATWCGEWSYGDRTPTADCIGLVLWASGIDRHQPGYHGSLGEDLNCESLMDDAAGLETYCRYLRVGEFAEAGDWLMTKDHIGMIIRPDNRVTDHLVVDCSPRHGRDTAVNTGLPWSEKCEVVRYKRYTP